MPTALGELLKTLEKRSSLSRSFSFASLCSVISRALQSKCVHFSSESSIGVIETFSVIIPSNSKFETRLWRSLGNIQTIFHEDE